MCSITLLGTRIYKGNLCKKLKKYSKKETHFIFTSKLWHMEGRWSKMDQLILKSTVGVEFSCLLLIHLNLDTNLTIDISKI